MPRRLRPDQITNKQKCLEFYNAWKWEKITFPSFYQKYNMWKGLLSMEEAIQAKKPTWRKKEYTWKWEAEFKWYENLMEPKAKRGLFRGRLNSWYCKEEAALVWDAREEAKERKKQSYVPKQSRPYVPQRIKVEKKPDPNNFRIEITLSKEEARIFRKEYVKMIEDIERELTYTEEKTQIVELNNKLESLYEELKVFNSYNR